MPTYNTPYSGPIGQVGLAERQRICAAVVGPVEWCEGGGWGYCTCPGLQFHHNKNGRRDCRVYAEETPGAARDGGALPPGLTCLHTSCRSAIEEASKRIRSEIGKAKVAAAGPNRAGPAGPAAKALRDTVAQVTAPRTARTPVFKCTARGQNDSRTARTDIARPYTLYAQAHTHTREPVRTQDLPSEPSTAVAPKPATAQPMPAPKPAEAERPGLFTLCLNGEPPARVVPAGQGFRTLFKFKSSHHD